MPHIKNNPARDTCPDFTLPMFRVMRGALVAYLDAPLVRTDGAAAQTLEEAWTEYNRQRQKEYKQQEETEWALRKKRNPFRRPPSPAPLRPIYDATDEPPDKKRKLLPIMQDRPPPDFIPPRPLEFAIKKIQKYQWVELWYFSREGCAEADRTPSGDEVFEMVRTVDDHLALRLMPPFAASKNVIPDAQMAWSDFTYAIHNYLAALSNADWPQEIVTSIRSFFSRITTHHLGSSDFGQKVLLAYQAKVRREWHIESEESDDIAFDISAINSSLLSSIMRQLSETQEAEQRQRRRRRRR